MSRCFPFPPPGYAKKACTHDVDLLKKEKEKEKKRKKEKKDKEKRENKEKREEKDRSDGKHRDKKDSKENHRDKKDRDKDKHGSSHAGEKKLAVQSEGRNKEKSSDDKKLDKKTEGNIGEEGRNKDRGKVSGENRIAGQLAGFNGQRLSQNSHLSLDSRNSTSVQGLDRKVRDEDREASNQSVGTERKREGTVRLVSSNSARSLAGGKEKNDRSGDKQLDAKGFEEDTRFSASVLGHSNSEAIAMKNDGIPRQVETDTHWRIEGKGSDHKLEDKHKDNDREEKNHAKDKVKEKERTKAKYETELGEHGSLNEGTKVDLVDTVDVKTCHPLKGSYKTAVAEENLRKRKDVEKNGYANDIKVSKLARSSSSHSLKDSNSRTLQSCAVSSGADGHGEDANSKVDDRMPKENGKVHAPTLSFSLTLPSLVSETAGQVKEESSKPPHPDSKYLSQVLSVPKVDVIGSDFDEQEWLFDESGSQLKRPKIGCPEFDETPLVWAEAQRIESADIYALPYVIPY